MKTSSSSLRGTPVAHRGPRRGLRSNGRQPLTPQAFFNFFGGGDKKEEKIVYERVDDASLPFPRSLVSGTFIKVNPATLILNKTRVTMSGLAILR